MAGYRILSLDGGGVRGVLTAALLERLEEAVPGFLSKVDLFAGTSTGGLLALALAGGMTPKECRELYEKHGQEIFTRSPFGVLIETLFAKYKHGPLVRSLPERLGDLTLGDLSRKVLICTFDLDSGPVENPYAIRTWKPKFFHNYEGPDSDAAERLVNVALRTCAAPSYFPIYEGYIDGGVVANNPSTCAVAQALSAGRGLDDLVLLSIGTGRNPKYLDQQSANWGWVRWARFKTTTMRNPVHPENSLIVDLLIEGTGDVAHYQCRQLLKKRFHRVNVRLPERIDLDSVGKIPHLLKIAAKASKTGLKDDDPWAAQPAPTVEWLHTYFC